MGKLLTREEFFNAPTPNFWIRVSKIKEWKSVQVDLCEKWLMQKIPGWFYHSDDYWVFENASDVATFKLKIVSGAFEADVGVLE